MVTNTPQCIGLILDGNRRWAKERGLTSLEGHTEGLKNLETIVSHAKEKGIAHVAVYAFSTENWNRTEDEVAHLMDMFRSAVHDAFKRLQEGGARLHFVGDTSRFPNDLQEAFAHLEEESSPHEGTQVWVCVSYGGRLEILQAVTQVLDEGGEVTEERLRNAMWSTGMPDPDIIIRTGGDKRLSNFLLWQSAYTELFFVDTYWPAFSTDEFDAILEAFAQRERRYGT